MPWRLIGFVIIFAVFLAFISLNLDNTSDIHLGFHKFEDVQVFLTVFASFFLGMIFAIPVVISAQKRRGNREAGTEALDAKPKKKWGKKKGEDTFASSFEGGGQNGAV